MNKEEREPPLRHSPLMLLLALFAVCPSPASAEIQPVDIATISMTNATTPKLAADMACYSDGRDLACDRGTALLPGGTISTTSITVGGLTLQQLLGGGSFVAKAGDTMSGNLGLPNLAVGIGADYAGIDIRSYQTGFPYIDFSINNSTDYHFRQQLIRGTQELSFAGADGNTKFGIRQNGTAYLANTLQFAGGAQYQGDGNIYMPWLGDWLSNRFNQDVRNGATPTFNTVYTPNWFRSSGNSGWFNETYGGGWHMTDTTWLRAYNGKWVYTGGAMQANHSVRTPALCDTGGGNCLSPGSLKWAHDSINGKVNKVGDTMTGFLTVNNDNPSVALQDTNGLSTLLHTNSDHFYILRSANYNAQDWTPGAHSAWPLQINLWSNEVQFGGNINTPANVRANGSGNFFNNTAIASGGSHHTDWPGGWGGGLSTWDINAASIQYSQIYQRSDLRHKKNIVNLEGTPAIDRLMHLRPVQYEWKTPTMGTGTQYGFVAQEVETLWPELVLTADNTEKTKSMNYTAMIAPLVEAVQTLRAENDGLKHENQRLWQAIEALDKKMNAVGQVDTPNPRPAS